MSVTVGSQLGPYEILSPLGAGGMGEVYRARDTRLGRDVAVKLLPHAFTADASRRARFEQEARAVAALNHPNIVAIYDIGDNYIVSELVEGDLLRTLIAEGPLPARRVVDIGAQIADGLAAAHAAGIVHRDLKPENVMITRDGRVKILDFGLARQVVSEHSPEHTRTILATATLPGMIMGTVAYMSPEQVRGHVADHRSDIFSLGIILHEMISGAQPFRGDSSVEAMNAVLKEDAPELPSATSPALRLIVARCLEKDPRGRFQSASDLAFALRSVSSSSVSSPAIGVAPSRSSYSRFVIPLALAVATLALIAAAAAWYRPSKRETGRVVRLVLPLPAGDQLVPGAVAVSPDGNRILYIARRGGVSQLFLRSLDESEPRALAGTEDATQPVFSYNGDSVVFLQQQKLKRLHLTGGSVTEIAGNQSSRGLAVMPDGVVAAAPSDGSIKVYAEESRSEKTLVEAPKAGQLVHPYVLPGGKVILYTKVLHAGSRGMIDPEIFARRLGGEEAGPIAQSGARPHYASGYLLSLTREGAIFALPFDTGELKATGKAMLAKAGGDRGASAYDVAGDVLVYVTGDTRIGSKQLISVDRSGTSRTISTLPSEFLSLSLSPDGHRVALAANGNESDLWTYDIERSVASRVSFEQEEDETPVWSPDGGRLAYAASRNGKRVIATRAADGSGGEQVLCTTEGHSHVSSWSPDGKSIIFSVPKGTGTDIWVVSADGSLKAKPFIANPFSKTEAVFSPGGQWLAYTSNESGRREVYVTAFPGPGSRLQISNMGGIHPVWSRNGGELYYRDRNHIMSVSIQGGAELKAGAPRPMFDAPEYVAFGVTPDGRFIALQVEPEKNPATLNVVINWTADLKRPDAEESK